MGLMLRWAHLVLHSPLRRRNSLKRGEHGIYLLLSADQSPAWLHSIPLKRLGKDFKLSSFGKWWSWSGGETLGPVLSHSKLLPRLPLWLLPPVYAYHNAYSIGELQRLKHIRISQAPYQIEALWKSGGWIKLLPKKLIVKENAMIMTSTGTPTTVTWGFCAPLPHDSASVFSLSRYLRTWDADRQPAGDLDGGGGAYDGNAFSGRRDWRKPSGDQLPIALHCRDRRCIG